MTWQLTIAGLLTGLLVGMTGMGGGSLMTPILVFIFGIPPSTAIGTDIAHGAVFKSVGAVQHRRMGNVRARLAGWMLIGSIPASLLGVWLNEYLTDRYGDEAKSVLGQVLGAALLFGAIGLIAKSLVQSGGPEGDPDWTLTTRDKVAAIIIGVFGGFIVGLTSVGSGTFFGLVMVMIYPLTVARIVGTDIFHAAALLWVAGIGHLVQGNVDLHAMAWLLLGSIPGIWISSRYTLQLPQDALRLGLAGVLALSGIKLLNVPESNYVIAVGIALGLGAFVVWLLLQSRRSEERADSPRASAAGGDGDGVRSDAAVEARAEPDLADARR